MNQHWVNMHGQPNLIRLLYYSSPSPLSDNNIKEDKANEVQVGMLGYAAFR